MKICGLKLADIGLKLKNTFKYVVCGFGLVFFTFAISYGLEVALLAEEGMFRGFILKVVTERSGFKTGNYLQAFLFGIWHIVMCVLGVYDGQMSVGQAVIFAVGYVVLAGILALEWGTCVSMTGVLWVGPSEHFYNNFIGNFLHVVSSIGTDEFQIIRIVLSNFLSLGIVLLIFTERFCFRI